MTKSLGGGLLGVAMIAMLSMTSGCMISGMGNCYDDCDEVCDTYCDSTGCWEDCYSTNCVTVCEDDTGYNDRGYSGCYDDYDCPEGYGCDWDECVPLDGPEPHTGVAGFCQACETQADCIEPGALCIEINGSERVCARTCDAGSPCPVGFECRDISQQAGVPDQCVPMADPDNGNVRSCEIPDEPECLADADCGDGSCVDGTCVAAVPECTDDGGCGDGSVCVDGACEPAVEPACVEDLDCTEGEICTEGECVAVETPECSEDLDCAWEAGETCVDGACLVPAPVGCSDDSGCAAGEVCVEQACSGVHACVFNDECPEAWLCIDGMCDDPSAGCSTDAECPDGQVCLEGLCEVPIPDCEAHADCEDGQICLDGACIIPECTHSSDCEDGNLCVNATCQQGCTEQSDCPADSICVEPGFCTAL